MFFPRLRRHAKWMFVFLAVALGGGFVLFGVGAGGTGVGDILRGGGGSSGVPSISSAHEEDRGEPEGRRRRGRELSTALQTDGQTDEAIDAQKHVVALAPKDTDALRELAGALPRPGDGEAAGGPAGSSSRTAYAGAGQSFPGALVVADRPVARRRQDQRRVNDAGLDGDPEARRRGADRVGARPSTAYKQIAKLQPNDPNIQLELAQAAQQAGDTATAIAAYTTFLKLAPDDPNAPIVKQQLKQLRQTSAASG